MGCQTLRHRGEQLHETTVARLRPIAFSRVRARLTHSDAIRAVDGRAARCCDGKAQRGSWGQQQREHDKRHRGRQHEIGGDTFHSPTRRTCTVARATSLNSPNPGSRGRETRHDTHAGTHTRSADGRTARTDSRSPTVSRPEPRSDAPDPRRLTHARTKNHVSIEGTYVSFLCCRVVRPFHILNTAPVRRGGQSGR